jgi:hypothetical protein
VLTCEHKSPHVGLSIKPLASGFSCWEENLFKHFFRKSVKNVQEGDLESVRSTMPIGQ